MDTNGHGWIRNVQDEWRGGMTHRSRRGSRIEDAQSSPGGNYPRTLTSNERLLSTSGWPTIILDRRDLTSRRKPESSPGGGYRLVPWEFEPLLNPSVPPKAMHQRCTASSRGHPGTSRLSVAHRPSTYHSPVFSMDAQGSAGASESPSCSNSMEMPSGERTNAMRPSRGGRLMMTPPSIRRWQLS